VSTKPKRPLQHRLETGSRRAFEALLPLSWTVDERSSDYGVDLDVEVFDEDDATGIRFNVQLKSRDETAKNSSVRLKWSTMSHWHDHDLPTLVVLWDRETNAFWWEWSHRLNTYEKNVDVEKVSVSLPNSWDETTLDALLVELKKRRAVSKNFFGLPLFIEFEESEFLGVRRVGAAAVARLSAAFSSQREWRVGGPVPEDSLSMHVSFHEKEVDVRLSGRGGGTLHYTGMNGAEATTATVDLIVDDVLAAIARELAPLGLHRVQADLLARASNASELILSEDVIGPTMSLFCERQDVSSIMNLLERSYLSGDSTRPDEIVYFALRVHESSLEPEARIVLAASIAASGKSKPHAATILYNSAQMIRADNTPLSLSLLRKAALSDPAYRDRDYWWRDLGAIQFKAGNFAESTKAYRRAISLGDSAAAPYLADALFAQGKLRPALDAWDQLSSDNDDAEWRMKRTAFRVVLEQLGKEPGRRNSRRASTIWKNDTASPQIAILALEADYLFSPALNFLAARNVVKPWFRVAAALADVSDTEQWCQALVEVAAASPTELDDVATCAVRMGNDAIADYFFAFDNIDENLEVQAAIQKVERQEPSFELRDVTQGSGDYKSEFLRN
jgi:tetratricopeptide (TPR) repeat protein